MLKLLLVLIILAIAVPVIAGVSLPNSFQPDVLGRFLFQIIQYWTALAQHIMPMTPGYR